MNTMTCWVVICLLYICLKTMCTTEQPDKLSLNAKTPQMLRNGMIDLVSVRTAMGIPKKKKRVTWWGEGFMTWFADWLGNTIERRRPGQQSPNSNTIQVNPPTGGSPQQPFKTSTSVEQLSADEELARRLAYEEDYPSSPPPMPARPTSQSPPQANLSPVQSPVQSPNAQQSPISRSIDVNPRDLGKWHT
jgi:hypothetical protein